MKESSRKSSGGIAEQDSLQAAGGRPVGLSSSQEGARLLDRISELEADIAVYRTALDDSRAEMQSFAYSVSHDLRAPLRAIEGFSKIVLEDFSQELDPEGQRLLKLIVTNTEILGSQIEDLLRFYRICKNPPNRLATNADELCRGVLDELKPGSANHIEIPEPLPVVFADPIQLREVFRQLLENAVKFCERKPDPRIEVRCEFKAPFMEFSVQDNGIGFDSKHAEKIFQVFHKLHPSSEYSGNGIGLAIVRRVILAHGGSVEGKGIPGQGATFTFTLPGHSSGNGGAQ